MFMLDIERCFVVEIGLWVVLRLRGGFAENKSGVSSVSLIHLIH